MTEVSEALLAALNNVATAAIRYRAEEARETPRLYKAKKLCDLSDKLDQAIEQLQLLNTPPQVSEQEHEDQGLTPEQEEAKYYKELEHRDSIYE